MSVHPKARFDVSEQHSVWGAGRCRLCGNRQGSGRGGIIAAVIVLRSRRRAVAVYSCCAARLPMDMARANRWQYSVGASMESRKGNASGDRSDTPGGRNAWRWSMPAVRREPSFACDECSGGQVGFTARWNAYRLRVDSTGPRGVGPERALEFEARSLRKRLRNSPGNEKTF